MRFNKTVSVTMSWMVVLTIGVVSGLGAQETSAVKQPAGYVPMFANSGLTEDVEKLAKEQAQTFFPDGDDEVPGSVRSEPEPWFRPDHPNVQKSFFKSISAHQAVETVLLKNGANLIIANWGWEFYATSLRIVFAETAQMPEDAAYWFSKTAAWLDELAALTPHTVFHLQTASQVLRNAVQTNQALRYAEDISVEPGEIAETIAIQRVGALPDGQGSFIELKCIIGPL